MTKEMPTPLFDYNNAVAQLVSLGIDQDKRLQVAKLVRDNDSPEAEVLYQIALIKEAYHNQYQVDRRGDQCSTVYPLIDHVEFKNAIVHTAEEYCNHPLLHSPALTRLLLQAVLDTEIYPLKRDAKNPLDVMARSTEHSGLKMAIMNLNPTIAKVSYVLWVLQIMAALAALIMGHERIAISIAIYTVLNIAYRFWIGRQLGRVSAEAQFKMEAILNRLVQIREEIAQGAFNAQIIKKRLERGECEGLWVPSVAYTLLDHYTHQGPNNSNA